MTQLQYMVSGYVTYILENHFMHGGMSMVEARGYCAIAEYHDVIHTLPTHMMSDCVELLATVLFYYPA